ncbi:ATP-dependent DNA helicase [Phytophthora megakarya]|uniref:DNA 3'-5' helicase n=1 Tax=Phytophthora megakarya TaxID=4795 RepID=A0A225WX51_9STRA|nr:ATP-dependent DNA helicase [Phytophthora megakarya]
MEVYVRPGLTTTDLLDEQAGHSHQTANTVYARSANDPSSLTRDQLEKFWNASREWHFFLNLEKRSTQSVDISRIDCTLPPTNQTSICFQSDEPFTPRIEKLTFLRLANSQTQRDVEPSKISPYAFANAKQVVEKFIGDGNATFTSVEQGVAIATLLSLPHCHRLIVLPTGGGKSLLYMAPYIADPRYKKTSLVIVPSVALLNESVTKCNVKGVSSCKFSQKLVTSSEQYCLIFAAAEQIKLESFRNYFSMQVNTKRTNMIFVDEAHLVATASCYRPDMLFVPTLVSLGIPLTLLSATIPPYLTRELTTMFHANFDVIRASTNRSNLVYRVKIVSDLQNEVAATMKFKQESLSDNRTRFIAYCMTRKEVDEIWDTLTKTSMSVSRYHSKMTSTEQSKSVAQWKKGFHKWMLATSAFGVGIDYPHVRLVLHVGSTYSIIDYAQETGRAGRDGLTSDALVLTTRNFQYSRPNIQQGEQSKHFQEVNKFLLDKTQCRRQYLQTIIDGNGVPCLADITNRMCDFCQSTEHRPTCNENPEMISENIVEAGQHARVLNANTRIIQGEICCFLNRLPVGFCAICWVRGHQNHTGKSVCPWLQGSCFKCQQSGHGSRSCNFVPNFPNGTCFFCGLPWIDVAGIGSMHHPHNYVNCTHPAKGVVIAACWATFHAREFDDIPVDATEFVAWLPSTSSICQFSNLVVLFSKLLQIKGA